jgi:hypothetical protein
MPNPLVGAENAKITVSHPLTIGVANAASLKMNQA